MRGHNFKLPIFVYIIYILVSKKLSNYQNLKSEISNNPHITILFIAQSYLNSYITYALKHQTLP